MTVLAREESDIFLRMPSKSSNQMSFEETLREMEDYLDGKINTPQSTHDVYVDINEPMTSSVIRQPKSEDPNETENSSSFGETTLRSENDVYVDIIEPMTSSVIRQPKSEDPNETENSSSFGETTSRSENVSETSDVEVESEFRVDNSLASTLDRYNNVFPTRKKKLTNHWRNFIQPLMWRCKWTELKIKELELKALKYSRKFEVNEQTKLLGLHQFKSDFCSKLLPFFNHSSKRRLMRRRKRKLVEKTNDISSYMSHHQLFSYLENKKSDLEGTLDVDDDVNQNSQPKNDGFCMDYDWLQDSEDLEQILKQIDTVQSQVHRLRSQLDTVMLKNGVKFSSSENLSLLAPYDAQTSAAQSPVISAGNGDNMSIEHLADFDLSDLVLPESIVSSYGDGAQIPDIIESTVGLLSASEITLRGPQLLESGENILGDTLLKNKEILDDHLFSGGNNHPLDEYQSLENKKNILSITVNEKSILKSCSYQEMQVPNKRKRGERKPGPGAWIIRSEPEST